MGEKNQFFGWLAGTSYGAVSADTIVANSQLSQDILEGSEAMAQALEGEPVLSAGARILPAVAVTAPVVVGGLGTGKAAEKGVQAAEHGYRRAGDRLRGVGDRTADVLDAYQDEDAAAGEIALDGVREFLQDSGEQVRDRVGAAQDEYSRLEVGGAAAGLGAGLATSYALAFNYPDLQEPIASDLAPVLDVVAGVSPEAAAAVPFVAVVGAGALGASSAGKGLGRGAESLYDAVGASTTGTSGRRSRKRARRPVRTRRMGVTRLRPDGMRGRTWLAISIRR